MLRFGETIIAKETFYAAKKPISIWDVGIDNIVISKLIERKTNSKYLIGYLDKVIRLLVLIMPKMSRYVATFKVKDRDKDKSNKLMPFHIDHEKILQKYRTICNKIEDLKSIELNALPVYDDRYIKNKMKMKTYSDKVYTNFRGLNVLEDDIECEFYTVISIDSLFVYEKNITCKYI